MKWVYIVLGVLLLFFVVKLGRYITTPVPGMHITEMGRQHVSLEEVNKTTYNSNPPTSGQHYEVPAKAGIYDAPQHDGQLIHSLEHGYVIISYNCNAHQSSAFKFQTKVYAHEEDASSSGNADMTANVSIPSEASGSAVNQSDACKNLVKELSDLAEKKKLFKLIVVPRPNLDTTIALTAWTYIDKFDQFDAQRIVKFIDYHRDHGPEQTSD